MSPERLLVRRDKDGAVEPEFSVFCVGYEQSRWRAKELVRDFFRRHLNSFALTYSEWKKIDGDSAGAALARSAKSVYTTERYQRRGEFGELFLHGILRDFYDAEPAVSKIYFLDSPNETAKGFDAVHVVVNKDDELDLWLGEAKLYVDMKAAIREIVSSLQAHIGANFLRQEFMAISNKLDEHWPHRDKLTRLLDENTSLDLIVDRLVIPVLLTFQSTTIRQHSRVSEEYVEDLLKEAQESWDYFQSKLGLTFPITIRFIVLPLGDTEEVRRLAHATLMNYQDL